jgi:hypothetical protein
MLLRVSIAFLLFVSAVTAKAQDLKWMPFCATSFKGLEVGYFENFGTTIDKDSVSSVTEKQIGTIGPDLFQNKILIIDYPQKRIGVCQEVPKQYRAATFQPFRSYECS